MKEVWLVLEGGGMRGLYTAGVLECFMEHDLYFPYVIGVSAGACMAASYLSRQKGRNKKVNIELVSDLIVNETAILNLVLRYEMDYARFEQDDNRVAQLNCIYEQLLL